MRCAGKHQAGCIPDTCFFVLHETRPSRNQQTPLQAAEQSFFLKRCASSAHPRYSPGHLLASEGLGAQAATRSLQQHRSSSAARSAPRPLARLWTVVETPANAVQMEGRQDVTDDEELFPGLDDRAQGGWASPQPQPGERDIILVSLIVSDRTRVLVCLDVFMYIATSPDVCDAFPSKRPQSAPSGAVLSLQLAAVSAS